MTEQATPARVIPHSYFVFDNKIVNEEACRSQGWKAMKAGNCTAVFIHFHLHGGVCKAEHGCYELMPSDDPKVEYTIRPLIDPPVSTI